MEEVEESPPVSGCVWWAVSRRVVDETREAAEAAATAASAAVCETRRNEVR
jgi:hypothetical protein